MVATPGNKDRSKEQGFDNPLVKFDHHRLLNTPSEISASTNMMAFGHFGALVQKVILETISEANHAYGFVVQFDCLTSGCEYRIAHSEDVDKAMIGKLQEVFNALPPLEVSERIAFQLQVSVDPARLSR
ncbi:MAG: hypothetical protein ACI959_000654 [Limisphaerales bacterium]|jgi:hypothetical protein